ncbi:hypothetical protein HYH02_015483, partial [Chlamydomonas schloesseri]
MARGSAAMASILALLVLASCCKSGVLCARMVKLAADDSASAMSDDMTSSSSALEQQQQQQELEAVVSALAHMNADSEAMRRVLASGAEHYVAGFSANATIVANLDVTDQASVDAFIAAFIQLTAAALRIDPANVYVTRITKGGVSSGRRRAALEQSGAAERRMVCVGAVCSAARCWPEPAGAEARDACRRLPPWLGFACPRFELVLGPGAAAGGARRSAQQQQQQQPPAADPRLRASRRSVVSRMPAHGTLSGDSSKPVVWYSDASFRSYRKPRSPLNLVFWNARPPVQRRGGRVRRLPARWAVPANGTHTTSLPLYFREPMQLDSIAITQLQSPGVVSVELLPWPATPIPELPGVAPVAGPKGPPVSESVPPRGSQSELPPRLRRTAVGGIRITVKAQAAGAKPTVISSQQQQQELEAVVSALAHMNADSEAMRRVLASGVYPPSPAPPAHPVSPAPPSPSPRCLRGLALEAEHYVAGFSANATIVANLDVTDQASV